MVQFRYTAAVVWWLAAHPNARPANRSDEVPSLGRYVL